MEVFGLAQRLLGLVELILRAALEGIASIMTSCCVRDVQLIQPVCADCLDADSLFSSSALFVAMVEV